MYSLDFVAITETWLSDEIDDQIISINGYHIFRNDRSYGRGGGVCAFVSADIPCKRRYDLEDVAFECLWVSLRPYRLPRQLTGLICCVLYNPPDTAAQDQRDLVSYIIDKLDLVKLSHPDCGVVILGDFNNLDVHDLLIHHNLKQIVQVPTRGDNILDLIITNLSTFFCDPVVVAPLGSSDHCIVKWVSQPWNNTKSYGKNTTKKRTRSFPQSACDAFGRWCSAHEWFTNVENTASASELATSLTHELNSRIDLIFPTKEIKLHSTDKPWITPALKHSIVERQKAFYSGDQELWRHYRRKVRNEILVCKRSYYADRVENLRSSNPRKWWDSVKKISGKKKPSCNAINIVKDGVTLSGKDLAQLLNDHFVNVSSDLPQLDLSLLPAYLPASCPVPTIAPEEVCEKLLRINISKSHGPDGIPNRILKEFAYELADPVSTIFNTSLFTGEVPLIWKDANITPIPKTQIACCEDELRPISLTANLSKILEDFVVSWMLDDIRHKIDPQQFGSLKGSSTTFCLIDMVNNWLKILDTPSHFLRICFVDFSKAFDRINHNVLVRKLLSLGVRESLVPWICDFLSNRRQSVNIDGFNSDWAFVNGGVPQGTKLGPILFLIMINDLELKSFNTNHWKYVDDVTISEFLTINEISTLQSDLDALEQWAVQNDMKLNGKKCKEMIISFLHNQPDLPRLCIEGQQLDLVSSFNVLGLTMNNKVKWKDNTEVLVKKASKRLYIIRILRRSGVSPSDLLAIYFALIRSVLEYACPTWHCNLPKYLSDKIELVQKRALRIIYPGLHYNDALNIAQCPRLDDRRQELCINTFKKIQEPCSRLHHLLPTTQEDSHKYNLRKNQNYCLPKCRTDRYRNSFIPAMCDIFNSF